MKELELETEPNARLYLASVLSVVSGRLDPTEAARICGRAAKTLAEALARERDASARSSLASALSNVAGWTDPTEAARICGQAAKVLTEALGREKDANARSSLASALSTVAGRMEPAGASKTLAEAFGRMADDPTLWSASMVTETSAGWTLATALSEVAVRMDATDASRTCGRTAKTVAGALDHDMDAYSRLLVASALSAVAVRMDPTEASRICGQAAKILAEALERSTDASERSWLASALSEVAGRMDPTEASRICGQAAKILAEALERSTDASERSWLASALSEVAGRMDPADASRICSGVIRSSMQKLVTRAPAGGPWGDPSLSPLLLRYVDRASAKALACEVSMGLVSKRNLNESRWSEVLDDSSTAEINRRAGFTAIALGQAISGQFPWAGEAAAQPFPCRLTTQELVELLKMPTCFGPARRVVLDHLGNRHGRRFDNHLAFVRFAREQGLELDFTTPPRRPDAAESVKRMLAILAR